jgi:hypothetical protein
VVVDGQTVPILGLGLISQELWALGEKPGASALRSRLMKMIQIAWHDRPPEISEETFMHILLKEYAIYWGQRRGAYLIPAASWCHDGPSGKYSQ